MNSRIADDHAAADLEDPARVGIDDQIEVALAVADLDVGQPVPLLRQRQQALGEEVQPRRPDRQLVGLGAEQPPLDADPVAEVEQLEDLEVERRQRVLADVDLDLRDGRRRATRKLALPNERIARMRPLVIGLGALGLELVVRPLAVRGDELGDGVLPIEAARVDSTPSCAERLEIRPALLNLFVL